MKPRIKLALGSYDRHGPLLESAIDHPLFDFEFFEVDPRQGRHERFLHQFEFDACELSFSSYVVAVDQSLPVHAVPIFPRRLFSQSQKKVLPHYACAGIQARTKRTLS
jgi:4,5-dihydroxyphthalate decarboxylase